MQKKNKYIGIFTPFPSIIGGGERYIFSLAECFSKQQFIVEILSPFEYNIRNAQLSFGLELKNCFYRKTWPKYFFIPPKEKKYQIFFVLSNHIIPPVFGWGKYNVLIVQFPFPFRSLKIGDILQRFLLLPKLASYQEILCYSLYTKKWILKRLPISKRKIKLNLINPCVKEERFSINIEKRNIILSVGRFFEGDHNKQHLNLISIFKRLINSKKISGWEFHIAGYLSIDKSSQEYFFKLKEESKDYPIFFHPNITNIALNELYSSATIFWHAAGYKNNEIVTPEKSEHFGIAVIEALASQCAVLAVNAGGISEIIFDGENGFLWKSLEQLYFKTNALIKNKNLLEKISNKGFISAKKYSQEKFEKLVLSSYSNKL